MGLWVANNNNKHSLTKCFTGRTLPNGLQEMFHSFGRSAKQIDPCNVAAAAVTVGRMCVLHCPALCGGWPQKLIEIIDLTEKQ